MSATALQNPAQGEGEILSKSSQVELSAGTGMGDSEWSAFMRAHGRPPEIGDERKPWEYPGWLLYYLLLTEERLDIPKRWDYWLRTMAAGRILDEPIPQVDFETPRSVEQAPAYKAIEEWVRLVEREGRGWSPMSDLIEWFLFGLGLANEMPKMTEKLQDSLYRTVDLSVLLAHPYDWLGEFVSLHKGKFNPNAFFPTPHSVVKLMLGIQLGGIEKASSVCDPCTGSGRMLLHASNLSLRLYGADIDRTMISIAKLNGMLYAPWLARPFPESFFADGRDCMTGLEVRDSLRDPPVGSDDGSPDRAN